MSEILSLNPEMVDAYKQIILDPIKFKMTFTPLQTYFEKSDTVTAKHILAKSYINHIQRDLPKVVLYIIMNDVYGQCRDKDADGHLGYYLKVKN